MKRVSKRKALLELAKAFTKCDAHSNRENLNHDLAVNLAYVLWQIYLKGGKVDDMDISSVERFIFSL